MREPDLVSVCVGSLPEIEAAAQAPEQYPEVLGRLHSVGVSMEDLLIDRKPQAKRRLPPVYLPSMKGIQRRKKKGR